MGSVKKRIEKHRKAKKIINKLYEAKDQSLIIHYSCESLYTQEGNKSPRITSIAVRFPESTQTKSFSIHKVGELQNCTIDEIQRNYDDLEKKMIKSFYQFVSNHKGYKWIHWKMNDINFGFEAIAHRYKVLGGKPVEIKDSETFDLSTLLYRKYGNNFIEHPRLIKLIEKNQITNYNFLGGKEEAEAFSKKEYIKLHQSTLRKVSNIDEIFQRSAEEKLKTNSKIFDKYGLSAGGIYEAIKENWLLNLLYTIFLIFLGVIIRHYLFP